MTHGLTRQHTTRCTASRWMTVCTCVIVCAACEPNQPTEDQTPSPSPGQVNTPPTAWRTLDDSRAVVIDDEIQAELDAAISEARETAEAARQRWLIADETQREHWAIKWAAPVTEGGVEHLWVRPVHWSAFRIEGMLVSPPQRAIEGEHALGDHVSFPIEELSDWIFLIEGRVDGPRNGGFTIDVLEAHFGAPRIAD